jgi:ABC-type glycerol-3-phosphate transport system substrate-binding protein
VKKRPLLLALLMLAAALALSACGSSGNSDESQIEEAIETSATTSDPANCTKYETQAFVEQSASAEGPEALKECEKEAKDEESKAESVEVTNVEVEGSEASAEAAVTGGSFDGQTLEIEMAKEGDQWKLNELAGFAKFDQAKIVEVFGQQLEKGGEVSKEVSTCIEEGLEEAAQPEVEELVLGGSTEPIQTLAEECAEG